MWRRGSSRFPAAGRPTLASRTSFDSMSTQCNRKRPLINPNPNGNGGLSPVPRRVRAGHTLGRLHASMRGRSGLRDTASAWLALDARRKQAAFERYMTGARMATVSARRTCVRRRSRVEAQHPTPVAGSPPRHRSGSSPTRPARTAHEPLGLSTAAGPPSTRRRGAPADGWRMLRRASQRARGLGACR